MEAPNSIRVCPCRSNWAVLLHSLHVVPFHHLLKPCRARWHNYVVFSSGCIADGPQLPLQEAAAAWSQQRSGWGLAALCRSGCSGLCVCSLAGCICWALCQPLFQLCHWSHVSGLPKKRCYKQFKTKWSRWKCSIWLCWSETSGWFQVVSKCLRLCYWRGALGSQGLVSFKSLRQTLKVTISPFLSSTGPVLKMGWMFYPCRSAGELPKTGLYSLLLEIFQTRNNDWCLVNCPVAQSWMYAKAKLLSLQRNNVKRKWN